MPKLKIGTRLEPYPFQQADVRKLGENDWKGFVVAETGAGKSLIGTEAGIQSQAKVVLIIAPLGTHFDVWRDGVATQSEGKIIPRIVSDATVDGKRAWDSLQFGEAGWYIITPQLFTIRDTSAVRADLAIVDEAHMLANRETAGWKSLNKLKATGRIVMSGTMVRNKVENFWGLLRWVYPEMSESGGLSDISFRRWVTEYMETTPDHFAPAGYLVVGEKDPGRIAREIPCYIQHFKRAECCEFHPNGFLVDLEEPVRAEEVVTMDPLQVRLIEQMNRDYLVWLDQKRDGMDDDKKNYRKALVVKLPVVMQTRMRQMTLAVPSFDEEGSIYFAPGARSPKLDRFHELLLASPGQPVVAFTSSEKFATEVTRRLNEDWGIRASKWAGTVSAKAREQAKEDLIAGRIQVIVGVIEAIGTGVDGLQHGASKLIWFERSRDLTANIQGEGRLDRRGQKERVSNVEIVAKDSIDQGIISKQLLKQMSLNRSLRRDIARELKKKADAEKKAKAAARRY